MKICATCKEEKLLDLFGKNKSKSDGLQLSCKPCKRATDAAHYLKSKDRQNVKRYANKAARQDKARNFVWNYLDEHPCVDCSEPDPIVLQFDHVTGEKLCNVSSMMANGASINAIVAEIAKCVVRCSNCHTRKTAKDFGWLKALR